MGEGNIFCACREYEHFGTRYSGYNSYQNLASERTLKWVGFAAGGCFVIWVTNRQEIPYTGRKHLILVPTFLELSLGQSAFNQVRQQLHA